jgi:flagellar biosynthetic protein FliR
MVVKAGLATLVAGFFTIVNPASVGSDVHWLSGTLLVVQESIVGLAFGLVAQMAYSAVHQGGLILAQQMGLSDAEVINPLGGDQSEAVASLLDAAFAVLFLAGGGLQLLMMVLARSYRMFPALSEPNLAALAQGVMAAGSYMMLFSLKLAAPALAAFLILAVVLSIMARIMPDMNILMESFPLRIGLGLWMAAAMIMPMNHFVAELAQWMQRSFSG